MATEELVPSPLARQLLELSERGAQGTIEIAGRTLSIAAGDVVAIHAAPDDEDMAASMVRAGQLSRASADLARRRAGEREISIVEALETLQVSPDELLSARRGYWVELLALGFGAVEAANGAAPSFTPNPGASPDDRGLALAPLLFDALARHALERDAALVERSSDRRLVWESGAHLAAARAWSGLEASEVAAALAADDGAAARIAALVRAGVLQIRRADESTPPPPPRRPSLAAAPPRASMPAMPMAPSRLDPGARVLDGGRRTSRMDRFPAPSASLDDPFDALERRIAQLEETEAPGAQRAEVWSEVAELWEGQAGAITEAARAYREAAAAAPDLTHALERAAVHCATMGEHALSAAYAHAMSAASSDSPGRARAFAMMARGLRLDGRSEEAAASYRDALACDGVDPELHLHLADLLERGGDAEGAASELDRAADALGDHSVERAIASARRAHELRQGSDAATVSLARALARYGFGEAAITLLAERILRTDDEVGRRDMILVAAQLAESTGRPDRAAELLMDAFDAEPDVDVFYELMAAHLELSGMRMDLAVMLEAIATANPWGQRAHWLSRAGEVFSTLFGRDDWARELHERALVEDPTSEGPLDALDAIARRAGNAAILGDALERAARATLENEPEAAIPLLERLADLAENTIGAPARALWAWRRLDEQRRDATSHARAEALERDLEPLNAAAEQAELEFSDLPPEARPAAALKLAESVRHMPDWRERAAELYAEALEGSPEDEAAIAAYESLLLILGDDERLDGLLERNAETATGDDLSRTLRWLAGLRSLNGDPVGSADACLRLLSLDPAHEEAIVRLDRAARRAGTIDLRRRALASRLSLDRGARQRALTFSRMASIDLREGDVEPAVDHARQAIRVDPGSTDALAVLLSRVDDLTPAEASEIFELVEAALGATRELGRAMLAHAEGLGDANARADALGRQAGATPFDGSVASAWLEATLDTEDASSIEAAARHGASPALADGPDDALMQRSAERIFALGEEGHAIRLLLDIARDRSSGAVARSALDLSRRAEGSSLDLEALELTIAVSPTAERGALLGELAEAHRRTGSLALESRTLLRQLAEGEAPQALQRLAELYAETGESDRLMAVLAVRLEGAEGVEARRPRLMDLAAAALRIAGDAELARAFLEQVELQGEGETETLLDCADGYAALGEPERGVALLLEAADKARAGGDREAEKMGQLYERAMDLADEELGDEEKALEMALRGLEVAPSNPGLLMGFERITLARRDVVLATRTYDRLAAESYGRHGRRGVRYRQARWFELAEAFPEALRAYTDAFAMNPSEGVVFSALERLSKRLGDYLPLVDAYEAIAEASTHVDRRVELMTRAADLSERRLDDPGRAFDRMVELWKMTGESPLLPRVLELAAKLLSRDRDRGEAAHYRILEILGARIEQSWDGSDKIRSLRVVGSIKAEKLHDLEGARAAIEEALSIFEEEDDVEPTLAAEAACDLAIWLAGADQGEDATIFRHRALTFDPDLERARALETAPTAAAETPVSASLVPLLDGLLSDLRDDPSDSASLRTLAQVAVDDGHEDLAGVALTLVSLFDHSVAAPADLARPGYSPSPPSDEELASEALLRHLFTASLGRHRQSPDAHGLSPAYQIPTIGERPLARAYAASLAGTGATPVPLYVHPSPQRDFVIAPGQPSFVIAAARVEKREDLLPFRVGRALALARPENALLASLDPEQLTTLFDAVGAAFGPAERMSEVSAEAKGIAADLWQTIAPKVQNELRDRLSADPHVFDEASMRAAMDRRVVLAGLDVDGRLLPALRGILADDPALRGLMIESDATYTEAVRASASLDALIRVALSETYLAAR